MAAGGAIAFKEGKEVKEVEYGDILADYKKEKERQIKEKEIIKDRNEGIREALEKSPTTPVPKEEMGPKELSAFPVAPPVNQDAPYPDEQIDRGTQKAGIATPAVKPAVGPSREDMYAAQEKLLSDQAKLEEAKSKKTVNQIIAERDEERTKAGFVDPAIAERKALDERKARIAADAQELAKDRLTQFLIDWGRTPGSALNGYINAGGKLIEANIEDKKLRKKLLDELDDARLGVNRGVYERRLGNEKEARTEIAQAGEKYYSINEKILQHKEKVYLKQLDLENKLAQMELKGEIAALKSGQNKAAIVQQAEIKARALVEKYVREIAAGTMTVAQIEDMALNDVLSRQPAVTAAGITSGPATLRAETGAEVDPANAETRRQEELRKQKRDYEDDTYDALRELRRSKEYKGATAEERAQMKKDKETELLDDYPVLKSERDKKAKPAPVTKPAPAAAPAPDKTKATAPKVETPPKISDVQGAPAGSVIGKKTDKGYEVLDKNGKLLGHTK
jgi:hypothetical protein